jgi:hypothetical protein
LSDDVYECASAGDEVFAVLDGAMYLLVTHCIRVGVHGSRDWLQWNSE